MIVDPRDVTPEWLTEVLLREEMLSHGGVESVRVILSKTLHASRVARLSVTYSSEIAPLGPKSLFLKLSLPHGDQQALADISNEAVFYQRVGAAMKGAPLVRCFDAGISADGRASYILLEDLSDTHFQPTVPHPPDRRASQLAVECLARFHARWWDDNTHWKGIGKVFEETWLETFLEDLEISVNAFLKAAGGRLSSSDRDIYRRMVASGRRIWGRLTEPTGLTITHGDTHWWNFLYPRNPEADDARLIDWQLWHIDLGPRDLAFLLALGGFTKRRRPMEKGLLRLYHDTLAGNGVNEYSWDDLFHDYRLSVIRNLNIPVIFWSRGGDEEFWAANLERAVEAFHDLDCSELI